VLTRALWAAVLLLVLIGVGAAIGRGLFIGDFLTRADSVRQRIMDAFIETIRLRCSGPQRWLGSMASMPRTRS